MRDKIINALHGTIRISKDFIISRQTSSEDLFEYFGSDKITIKDMKNGYVHYAVENGPIDNTIFAFLLIFYNNKLNTIIWTYDFEGDSWENWSKEKELKREEKYNNWLTEQVGQRRQFQWGTIWASFDDKCGETSLGLRYC